MPLGLRPTRFSIFALSLMTPISICSSLKKRIHILPKLRTFTNRRFRPVRRCFPFPRPSYLAKTCSNRDALEIPRDDQTASEGSPDLGAPLARGGPDSGQQMAGDQALEPGVPAPSPEIKRRCMNAGQLRVFFG